MQISRTLPVSNKFLRLLNEVSFSDDQIAQIENTLSSFIYWKDKEIPHMVRVQYPAKAI